MAENVREETDDLQKIDIVKIIVMCSKHVKKTWIIGLILIVACVGLLVLKTVHSYTPYYRAYVDLVVNPDSSDSTYLNKITVEQLSATFPYIVESGALAQVVAADLGEETVPATIGAAVLEDTNLFQIYAIGRDPEKTWAVVESVLENYPVVGRYIIGSTTFQTLDETGVPEEPYNTLSVKSSVAKGGAVGLGLYILIVVFFAMMRRTVVSSDDMKSYTQVKCLAGIPEVRLKKRIVGKDHLAVLVSDENAGSAFTESFSTLRIRTEKTGKKMFMVTSVGKDEGKTTVCTNLALSYSRKEYKVLLIDADLRNPSVARTLGIKNDKGLAEVLKGECSYKDVIVKYGESSLSVLPGGVPVNKIASLLGRNGLSKLISSVENDYDYIFVDAPPCSMMQDATLISESVKNVIIVVRQDFVMRSRVLECMEQMKEVGASLTGYVINREATGIGSYGYGKYGYGKYGYGKYGYGKYGHSRYGYGKGYGKHSHSSSAYGYGYGYGQDEDSK